MGLGSCVCPNAMHSHQPDQCKSTQEAPILEKKMPPRTARRRVGAEGGGGGGDSGTTERLKGEIKEGPQQAYEALQTARALIARWEGQGQGGRARSMGAELAKAFAEAGCVGGVGVACPFVRRLRTHATCACMRACTHLTD